MGDHLAALIFPTGRSVKNLWVADHVVVILDDDSVVSWGAHHA
jgi:hypothetical protein